MDFLFHDKKYKFCKLDRNNSIMRQSFNHLATETFGISFENWYCQGYWTDSYSPYVLTDGCKVVSNVSVNTMDCILDGKSKWFIQLGTVMTDKAYRNQGLCRFLIEQVLEEWIPQCDGVYLYANDSVIDFYPLFGFEKHNEFQQEINIHKGFDLCKKLNMESLSDIERLNQYCKIGNHFSRLALTDCKSLTAFYCTQFMKENVYYLDEYQAVVIAEFNADSMLCYEVFGGGNHPLETILTAAAKPNTRRVVFGFTPDSSEKTNTSVLNEEDTTFFWHKSKEFIFESQKMMFPLLSHA